MNTEDILSESEDKFNPIMALVVYESSNDFYIESHEIDNKGRMLAGVPLSKESISEIIETFSVEYSETPYGRTPSHMLYIDNRQGSEKYIWYNPPQKRMMYFSKKLKIKDQEYFVPGVIYEVESDTMNIYAFKGKKPRVNQKLYKAPFFNVTGSSVCLGNANISKPKDLTYEQLIDYWEKRFWQTEFTHLGGNSNPTKNNLVTTTKKWIKEFDYSELVESSKTLNMLLR